MTALEFNRRIISYQNPLKYFALKLTSDNEDAEDLLQETFLKALRYKDKFQESTNLKAWLYTIMKNTFINNYRRKVRKRTIMDNTDDDYFVNSTTKVSPITPDSDLNHKEILGTVELLSDECRVPFQMHFDGYKYKEIADELQMPIGTVKSRIFLARKKLTGVLKDFAS